MQSCPVQRLQALGRHFQPDLVNPKSIRVVVTGAAGNIGYTLVHMIGQGRLLGPHQPISLTLIELPMAQQQLEGTIMELKDCALPLLTELKGTTDYKEGFKGVEIAILVGAKPRGPGMERKDLLGQNAVIFRDQGKALEQYADKNVKVLVVGNPANTNALICSHYAPKIPRENFTALTRLDQNRGTSLLAQKLNCPIENIKNVIIWGNHSVTQFADLSHATVQNDKFIQSVTGAIGDDDWVQKQFTTQVAKRGGAIIEKRKSSSAASAANAICDHIHDWIIGSKKGEIVSMGVITNGKVYGLPEGINFSLPCVTQDGKITIVEGLKWNTFSQSMIEKTKNELIEEKEMAFAYLQTQQ